MSLRKVAEHWAAIGQELEDEVGRWERRFDQKGVRQQRPFDSGERRHVWVEGCTQRGFVLFERCRQSRPSIKTILSPFRNSFWSQREALEDGARSCVGALGDGKRVLKAQSALEKLCRRPWDAEGNN